MNQNGERALEAELYRLRGELLCAAGDPDFVAVRGSFAQAADIADKQAARLLGLRVAISRLRLCPAAGRVEFAEQTLRELYSQFTEGFATADLLEARNLLGGSSDRAAAFTRPDGSTP